MTKTWTILLALVCVLLTPGEGKRFRHRRKFNQCDAVGLSLPHTRAALLASKRRIKVGEVSLSTKHGNLVTDVKLIHGCKLVHSVRADIFPGNSLKHVLPFRFPCKKAAYGKSASLSCPIKKFSNIVDCCAEHFVIAVLAIVKCRIHGLRRLEYAYAAAHPSHSCTSRHRWCNYVPVKLIPGCKGRGCFHDIPFKEVCKHNRCVKEVLEPCKDRCEGNTPILSKCIAGYCKEDPQEPCVGDCKHNIPISSTCVKGKCEKKEEDPCVGDCKHNTPISSTCVKGKCEKKEEDPCVGECKHNIPISSTCVKGKCEKKEEDPCVGECKHNTPISSTCVKGKCERKKEEPCDDKCTADHFFKLICDAGKCKITHKKECKGKTCKGRNIVQKLCLHNKCVLKVTRCGKCEWCSRHSLTCVKKKCPHGKILNEHNCHCCRKCGHHEVFSTHGCGCVSKH